jgi:hypothetical protein
MMCGELLSLNDQRISPLFAYQDDRDLAAIFVDIEKNAILSEEAKFSLCNGIRTKLFLVTVFCERIGGKPLGCSFEKHSPVLLAKPE